MEDEQSNTNTILVGDEDKEISQNVCRAPLSKKRKNGETVCGRKINDGGEKCAIHSKDPKAKKRKRVEIKGQDYREALEEKEKKEAINSDEVQDDDAPAPTKKRRRKSPSKKKPSIKKKKSKKDEISEDEDDDEDEIEDESIDNELPISSSEIATIALDALPSGVETKKTKKFTQSKLGERLGNMAFGGQASSTLSKNPLLSYLSLSTLVLLGENRDSVSKYLTERGSKPTQSARVPPSSSPANPPKTRVTRKTKKKEISDEIFDGTSI
jgi:hypothetical protein